jgi:hypothetical protein
VGFLRPTVSFLAIFRCVCWEWALTGRGEKVEFVGFLNFLLFGKVDVNFLI